MEHQRDKSAITKFSQNVSVLQSANFVLALSIVISFLCSNAAFRGFIFILSLKKPCLYFYVEIILQITVHVTCCKTIICIVKWSLVTFCFSFFYFQISDVNRTKSDNWNRNEALQQIYNKGLLNNDCEKDRCIFNSNTTSYCFTSIARIHHSSHTRMYECGLISSSLLEIHYCSAGSSHTT